MDTPERFRQTGRAVAEFDQLTKAVGPRVALGGIGGGFAPASVREAEGTDATSQDGAVPHVATDIDLLDRSRSQQKPAEGHGHQDDAPPSRRVDGSRKTSHCDPT